MLTLIIGLIIFQNHVKAQGLESLLDSEMPELPQPVFATFKSSRIINLKTPERVAPGNLEFRISHRFGPVNGGAYQLWGLDQSTIRIGLDYGVTDRLMVGFGRSSLQKNYDGYFKYAITQQKTLGEMPVSIVAFSSIAVNTLEWSDPSRDNHIRSRLAYVNQLIIARKFNGRLSLELVPSWVHFNLVSSTADQNDIPVLGIGGRYKIGKRVSIDAEYGYRYQYKSNASNLNLYQDTFSVGIGIETGGHVFQFQLTNSLSMIEKGFLTETIDSWRNGGIHLGFNITREFVLNKKN
ncbi:MAG: DUF5777 family beta-barrel protein [Bacteroidota bacterium]